MNQPATLAWFAAHEFRLVWRDWISFRTGGKRSREPVVVAVAAAFILLIHLLAYAIIDPLAESGISADKTTLVMITGSAFMSWTLMLSQAIESVTRAFYARADLDLILSSPTPPRRVFAVRMVAVAIASTLLTTALAAPFVNVLALYDGSRWLAGYGVLCAMGALSTAVAIVVAIVLFRSLGPRRTRLVSQVVSAVIAATFVIGVQVAAILATGSISRFSLFRSERFVALAPDIASPIWWPARAAMGDPVCLAVVLGIGLGLLAFIIAAFCGDFGDNVMAAAGMAEARRGRRRRLRGFRPASVGRVLRRKEWVLVRRDPWLMSQTLMQIFYLVPPAVIIWLSVADRFTGLLILVPILVMASGQLAGGLSWLVVSGEDAPDLVASAPISARAVISAKIEFVVGGVFVVAAPLLVALAFVAPRLAAVAAIGVAVAAASGTAIQFWFRDLARRQSMRRRQYPSRLSTLAEALAAILWAGTAALAAAGSWLASVTAIVALLALAGIWMLRPRQDQAA